MLSEHSSNKDTPPPSLKQSDQGLIGLKEFPAIKVRSNFSDNTLQNNLQISPSRDIVSIWYLAGFLVLTCVSVRVSSCDVPLNLSGLFHCNWSVLWL